MRIGLVHNWPGSRNSELDLIGRIQFVLNRMGHEGVLIDPFGNVLDDETGEHYLSKRPQLGELDFYLNLHYLNPKLIDSYSYIVNWNPTRYLVYNPTDGSEAPHWHLDFINGSFISHDYILSASSRDIDDFAAGQLTFSRWSPYQEQGLNLHTTCQLFPEMKPVDLEEWKVFYIGANWERLAKARNPDAKVRHEGLLEQLDRTESFVFYGLRENQGVFLWEGIKNYRGELPFDAGESIVTKSNEYGISLVLSSDAHRDSGVVSTRLFQACAARSVVISDDNPFVAESFGDSVLTFEYADDTETTYKNIMKCVNWVKKNPVEAKKKAEQSYQIFKERFSLDAEIGKLIDAHPDNLVQLSAKYDSVVDYNVDVFFLCCAQDIKHVSDFLDQIGDQNYVKVRPHIVVPQELEKRVAREVGNHEVKFQIHGIEQFDKKLQGQIFYEVISEIEDSDFIALWTHEVRWYSNHLGNLLLDSLQTGSLCVQGATYVRNAWFDAHAGDSYFAMHSMNAIKRTNAHSLLMLELESYQPASFLFCSKLLYENWAHLKPLVQLDAGYYFYLVLLSYLEEQRLPTYVPKLSCEYSMPADLPMSGERYPEAHDFRHRVYRPDSKRSAKLDGSILFNAVKHHRFFWREFSALMETKQSAVGLSSAQPQAGPEFIPVKFSFDAYMRGVLVNRPLLLKCYGGVFWIAKRILRL